MLCAAHFQLTGRCNLRCPFCGQRHGALAAAPEELTVPEWRRVARELAGIATDAGQVPRITLWGGEPLLYPGFDELAQALRAEGFFLEVITNGTLIDRHETALRQCFDRIYVSLDGGRDVHDAGRGAGVFDRVAANLARLQERRGKLIFLTTCTDVSVRDMARLADALLPLGPDRIVLQQQMYLEEAEIAACRAYARAHWGGDYPGLDAWKRGDDAAYLAAWRRGRAEIEARPPDPRVRVVPLRYPDGPADGACCRAPWHRVHVRHDGEVGFCTDYFGFSAGNVRREPLAAIFSGDRAERFRAAVRAHALPICRHCPWRDQPFPPETGDPA